MTFFQSVWTLMNETAARIPNRTALGQDLLLFMKFNLHFVLKQTIIFMSFSWLRAKT